MQVFTPFNKTDLIQQMSSHLVKMRSFECSDCVSSDCSIKTGVSGRSSHWWVSISGDSYTMKAKEHLMQLWENATEKCKLGNGYKNISKSHKIPLISLKPIIKKRKEYDTYLNLPGSGHLHRVTVQDGD